MKTSALRIARMSAYAALTVGIIVLTIILVAIGRGYVFDFKTGQVEGGGLILLDSEPSGAKIYIDGQDISKNTPNRLSVRAGEYSLRLEKPGFANWQKKVPVVTSEVSWVQYAFLVPQQLKPARVIDVSSPSLVSQSPDRKFIAMIINSPSPSVLLYEPGKTEAKAVYSLSPQQVAANIGIENLVWAQDSEHILITIKNAGVLNYSIVNVVNPAELTDLTHDFGTNFAGLQFSARNWRELYWHSPEGLRKLDVGNRTISAVLATDVSGFIVSPEAVFYVKTVGDRQQLMRLDRDNQSKILANNLPVSEYLLAYSAFEGKSVVALADKKAAQLRLFSSNSENQSLANPFEHLPAANMVVSPDERYLVMFSGERFATYSFEFNRLYQFVLPAANYGPLSWFDNFHLLTNIGGTVKLIEFDGANQQDVLPAQPGLAIFSNGNRNQLYSVGNGPNGLQLQVTNLRP